jgi:hypothetical protein
MIMEPAPGKIFMRINSAMRWVMGVMGFALLGVSPYLWQIDLNFLWLIVPMLGAWAFWLVTEYLRWAEQLGRK